MNGTTTNYLYDGDQVIAEYDGSGTILRKFVFGPGIDEPVLMEDAATRHYYHADALGSVIALTNPSGEIAETYAYSSWGQVTNLSTLGNPYLYTGRRFDTETGLYYYRARQYSPDLRRFLQPDPIGFAGGMNLYAYVGNSPWTYVDPWGLHGLIFFGRQPFVYRPLYLRPSTRNITPQRVPKITPPRTRFKPQPINPVEFPTTRFGEILRLISDFLDLGVAGATSVNCDKKNGGAYFLQDNKFMPRGWPEGVPDTA